MRYFPENDSLGGVHAYYNCFHLCTLEEQLFGIICHAHSIPITINYDKCILLCKHIVFGIKLKLFQCRMELHRLNIHACSCEATGSQNVEKHNIFYKRILLNKHIFDIKLKLYDSVRVQA